MDTEQKEQRDGLSLLPFFLVSHPTCSSDYGIQACLAHRWCVLLNCAARVPLRSLNAVSCLNNTSAPWNSICRNWSSTWPRCNKRLLTLKSLRRNKKETHELWTLRSP